MQRREKTGTQKKEREKEASMNLLRKKMNQEKIKYRQEENN